MNHLAPLVVAVAQNEVLHDLQKENEELRNENCQLKTEGRSWTIQITGPGGSPVYSTGKITERELMKTVIEDEYHDGLDKLMYVVMNKKENCQLDSFREWHECQLVLTTGLGQVIVEQIDGMNGHSITVDNGLLRIEYGYSEDFWCMDGNDWGQALGGNQIIFSNINVTVPIPPDHALDPELQNRQAILTANRNLSRLTTEERILMLETAGPELQNWEMVRQLYTNSLHRVTTEEILLMMENTVDRDTPITITEVSVRMGDLSRTLS